MSDRDILKDKYKHLSPDNLVSYGLLSPAHHSGYICPFCGNGSGEDGTGIDMNLLDSGYEGHCFKCGMDFDVFKIIAENEHLDNNSQFAQIFQIAMEKFGDVPIVQKTAAPKPEKKKTDYTLNLKKWRANLKDFVKEQGGTYRGLLYEQLAKYFCGYEPNFISKLEDKKNNCWYEVVAPRFIIPSNCFHYLARLVGKADDLPIADKAKELLEEKSKQHFGTKSIFGKKLLPETAKIIFVTEGEFDAMSVDQCGYPAVSVSGSKISSEMKKEWKEFSADKKFIVLLDNDKTGKDNSQANAEIIGNLGFDVSIAHLDEKYKDANEFLQADSDGLTENLKTILQKSIIAFNNTPAVKKETPAEEKSGGYTTKEIIKNCPIDLYIPLGFKFSPSGIFKAKTNRVGNDETTVDKNGNESKIYIKVSDTPVVITRIIETTKCTDGQVEIAVYNKKNKMWHKHIIPRTDAVDSKAMTKLAAYGVSITTGRAKFMAEYLNDLQFFSTNLLTIPNTAVHSKPGWTDETCSKFIFPEGDGENYIIENNGFDYESAFKVKGDKNIWLEKIFKRLFKETFAFRISFGTTLSAPLLAPCNVRNLQLALIAHSSSGKSPVLKANMSFFGDPESLRRTLNTSAKSLDDFGFHFNDLTAWFDEFQSAPKKLKDDFPTSVYNFGEGATRGRLDRNANQKKIYKFRGVRLFSAEQPMLPPTAGQGAYGRLLEVNCKKILPIELALEIHELVKFHYGHFFKDWINYIIEHKEEIKADYIKRRDFYASQGRAAGRSFIDAHVQAVAISQTALIHFCKMLHIDEELDVEQVMANDFYDPLFTEIMLLEEDSLNITRALSFISEILETHQKHFIEENDSAKNYPDEEHIKFIIPTVSPIIGIKFCKQDNSLAGKWVKGGNVAFFPNQLRKLLNDAGFPSADAIFKGFHDEGYLIESGNEKHRYQKGLRYDNNTKWAFYFPAEVLYGSDN